MQAPIKDHPIEVEVRVIRLGEYPYLTEQPSSSQENNECEIR